MKLYESVRRNLKESVKDEAYEIADRIEKSFGDRDFVTRDDFDDAFYVELKKVFTKEDLRSADDNGGVLPDGTDLNDLETDVRSILGYNGWGTIFEGPEEGGLTTISPEDRISLAEVMCGVTENYFHEMSEDFNSRSGFYPDASDFDEYTNLSGDEVSKLVEIGNEISPKIDEIIEIIKKRCGVDLFESEKK